MERRRIDCPETQSREVIDFERTPCGVVITGCSRFEPRCAVSCSGACAKLLDERDRRDVDDVEPRVLVIYAGGESRTRAIAEGLAVHLSCDRLTVELADADSGSAPPPADYDAVVVGSWVRDGRHPRSVIEYVAHYREMLSAMPAYLFSVGNDDDVGRMKRATGWFPSASAVFEPRKKAGFFRRLAAWYTPSETSAADTRFGYSSRVRDFALKIAEEIPTPELVVTMRPRR